MNAPTRDTMMGLGSYLTHSAYGKNPLISPETAIRSARLWRLAWEASGRRLSVPDACTGPDGQMFYSWDVGRHHLELEIPPAASGEPAFWFYGDRRDDGGTWSEDWAWGDPVSQEAIARIGRLTS